MTAAAPSWEWAVAETARLNELRSVARELAVDVTLRAGRAAEAVPPAGALTREHPLREEGRRLSALAPVLTAPAGADDPAGARRDRPDAGRPRPGQDHGRRRPGIADVIDLKAAFAYAEPTGRTVAAKHAEPGADLTLRDR